MRERLYCTDRPTDHDVLGFSDFRPGLVEIITEGETPLTIGVFGRWGTGKTSLLKMLRRDVERKRGPRLRTVWFTAWKYDRHEALWRAFILRVLDALYPRKKEEGEPWEEQDRIPFEELDETQRRQVERLQRLEESVYRAVEWEEAARWALDLGRLGKEMAKLPGFLLLSSFGAQAVAKALNLTPDLAGGVRRAIQTHRMEQLTFMEQFENTLQRVLREMLGREGRLVVFVDDLDRCLPERAVEVLEAIKLFLEVDGTVFVLGLDRDVVRRGIEVHYRGKGGDLPIDGDAYLEKFIQIPFHLPPLTGGSIETLVRSLRGEETPASEPVELSRYVEERRIDEAVRQVFVLGLEPNPRQVKRAWNTFRLLQAVALVREARGTLLPGETAWPLLAKIVVLQIQYRDLYEAWMRPGRLTLPRYLEQALEAGTVPDEAPPGIREVIQGVLQDPDRAWRLRQVWTYSPEGSGRHRARFGDLGDRELEGYRSLTASLLEVYEERLGPLGEALRSGDPAQVWGAACRVWAERSEEREYARWILQHPEAEGIPEEIRQGALRILALDSVTDVVGFLVERLAEAASEELVGAAQAALEALAHLERTGEAVVGVLIGRLADEEPDVREAAAAALGRIGGPAVGPLIARLGDADRQVREAVASALGKIGDARAVEPLIARLGDADRQVRETAASALVQIGEPTVEPLIARLGDADRQVREAAASALGQIGDVRAVGPLIARLGDADLMVRVAAAAALEQIGDPKGLEAVRQAQKEGRL